MACKSWPTLSVSDFPELSSESNLILHPIGPHGEHVYRVDFKDVAPKVHPPIERQGVFKQLKK